MSWDRIRGHDEVKRRFQSANARGRLGQAYLFAGPEGVGKRLFARELAKALLCERPPAPLAACDRCPSCAQVEAGTHPDVFAIRTPVGKHELPIEVMREFCSRMALKPARGGVGTFSGHLTCEDMVVARLALVCHRRPISSAQCCPV